MNGLALCAGAGGLELGLHLAEPGYRTVGFVEREARAGARGGELLLRGQAKGFPSSLPGDSPNEHGAPCSRSGQTSPRRLNPLFVEWLMGWPLGWTVPGSPLPETEWSRWWRRMRGSLYELGWR
mgnify:CR=1 FL=1